MFSQLIGSPQRQEAFIDGPDGLKLSTVAWGSPKAPHHLLLIHGGYQAKETFREQFEALALADCYVVGFDLPFHGQSGPTPAQSDLLPGLPIWAESITAIRTHYQMSEAPVLLAWSLGGLVVRQYLSHQPSPAVGGLVFVAPLLDMHEGMAAWQQHSPNTLTIVEELEQENHFSGRAQAFLRFVEMLSENREPDYFTLGYNSLAFFKATHLSGMLSRLQMGKVDTFLGSIGCPVLFVQGTQDQLLPPQYTRSNVARIGAERVSLVELPCGHSPHLERPLAFNAAVFEFLVSLSQGRTAPLMHLGGNEG